jgi:hypothetical protein
MAKAEDCGCCCTSQPDESSCCCAAIEEIKPGSLQEIHSTTPHLTAGDRIDHILARLGINRTGHRVESGLYRLGSPTDESPVFVSANYTLSFDALRSALNDADAWILVLDTKGINVWCAAGKGTFGTDELVDRMAAVNLTAHVSHRTLILPQLGAPGVSAPDVARRTGFRVLWGPVRATDLPDYLRAGVATQKMRRITFPVRERYVLIPVELMHALPYTVAAVILFTLLGLPGIAGKILLAVLSGTVLFPLLLPVLPTKDYTTKGLVLGYAVIIPVVVAGIFGNAPAGSVSVLITIADLLIWPALTAFLALNFTGCTPFTSRSGVKTEIERYMRILAGMVASGSTAAIAAGILTVVSS